MRTTPGPAEPKSEWEKEEQRRRRTRALVYSGVGLVLVAALAVWLVQNAAGHYGRGRQAMVDRQYVTALMEFSAARLLFFSYRDADAQAAKARQVLDAKYEEAWKRARVDNAVRELVERAGSRLANGDAEGVATALRRARARVPEGPLSQNAITLALLATVTEQLDTACRQALADARWDAAETYGAALLTIDPEDENGVALGKKAKKGAALQRKLDEARTAADRGQWSKALRLADAVLDAWPGFPGAAPLVKQARAALAPEPPPPAPEPPPPPAPEPPPPPAPEPPAPPPP